MATDLSVVLADEPGKLAALGRALGSAGVNIEGIAGTTSRGSGVLHVLVDAGPAARKALEAAGIEVHTEREVVLAECDDRPGALGELADRLSQAGVNIDLVYLATRTRVVIGSDDPDATREALG